MKERPILFSGPMVQAILEDRKTQTRRVINWKVRPESVNINLFASSLTLGFYCTGVPSSGWVLRSREGASGCWNDRTFSIHCPHGQPGDRLWVRETFAAWYRPSFEYPLEYETITGNLTEYVAEHGREHILIAYRADRDDDDGWRPSIFMPRWASRIQLEITDVKVERVAAISESDARDEGAGISAADYPQWDGDPNEYRKLFRERWNILNAKRGFGWDKNPWVWCLTFKRVTV